MDYIVDPKFFYWANVVGNCRTFSVIMLFILSIACFILAGIWAEDLYDSESKTYKRILIIMLVFIIIFALSLVFIPNKETLIEMEIARHATKSNIQELYSIIVNTAKEIMEGLKK